MENKELQFTCFGEILFDVIKDEKIIGGAPLNVALRIRSFGYPVAMISAVGNDEDGKILKEYIDQEGIDISGISILNNYKTGLVDVSINESGSATYVIEYPSAWDKIEATDTMHDIVSKTDVFVYGSLVCRDEVSKSSLLKLLANNEAFKVFDANLRPPHYNLVTLKRLMVAADLIKFNDEELLEIAAHLGSISKSIEENIRFISKHTQTEAICVTKGKHGAVLLWKGKLYYNAGFLVEVVDTVGAGDSFLASLITKLLGEGNPQEAIDFACAIGAIVAGCEGANPKIDKRSIDRLLKPSF